MRLWVVGNNFSRTASCCFPACHHQSWQEGHESSSAADMTPAQLGEDSFKNRDWNVKPLQPEILICIFKWFPIHCSQKQASHLRRNYCLKRSLRRLKPGPLKGDALLAKQNLLFPQERKKLAEYPKVRFHWYLPKCKTQRKRWCRGNGIGWRSPLKILRCTWTCSSIFKFTSFHAALQCCESAIQHKILPRHFPSFWEPDKRDAMIHNRHLFFPWEQSLRSW